MAVAGSPRPTLDPVRAFRARGDVGESRCDLALYGALTGSDEPQNRERKVDNGKRAPATGHGLMIALRCGDGEVVRTVRSRDGSFNIRRIAAGVRNPKDQDVACVKAIEDAIREPAHPRTPDAGESVNRRCTVREREQPIHHEVEFVEKPMLEVIADSAIVITRLSQIADRELGEPHRHCPARKSART